MADAKLFVHQIILIWYWMMPAPQLLQCSRHVGILRLSKTVKSTFLTPR